MKIFSIILIVLFAVVSLVLTASDGDDCAGPNEVWNDCGPPQGGCFERVCGVNQPKGINCATVCRPKCYCAIGYIRQSLNGPCIREGTCNSGSGGGSGAGPKPCGDNEEYKDCGTVPECEPTCANREPGPCPDVCVEGCFCKTNYIRERTNGTCICIDKCKKKC